MTTIFTRSFIPATLLALAFAAPVQQAQAQDVLGGALLGGVGGAVIGGAVGGGRGAVIGAVVGAGTGAIIANEAQRRNGYYWHRGNCYAQRGDGSYIVVSPRRCGV
jgi:outer membrane lipoprotein SlyB